MISSLNKISHLPKKNASFTLVELLVVIGVLALLMSVAVITLNPTEMLKKGRDSKRISELKSINTALGIYQANKPTTSMGYASTTYISIPASNSNCSDLGLPTPATGYFYACSTTANHKKLDGTGWIPVNFNSLDIGSPLVTLPIDPINTTSTGLYYSYNPGGSWELTSSFESLNFRFYGESDKISTDGGDSYSLYEVGNDLTLNPIKDSGLVGYWRLDGGTSGAISNNQTLGFEDISGYSNNGTAKNPNGTGMAWTSGKAGGAVSFDGTDDYVNCGTGASLQNLPTVTIEAWVKPASTPTYGNVVAKMSYANGGLVLRVSQNGDGRLTPHVYTNTWHSCSGSVITLNAWTQIALRYDGTTLKGYVNGVENCSVPVVGGNLPSNATAVWIDTNTSEAFPGLIDDVRIYNRALSAAEIIAIYNASR